MYSQPLISRFQRGVGWGRILWGRAKGVLNAAVDFKISERRIRRDGHRILPDRGRSEHCDCHRRQRHRQHPQHQIHLGQYFAEIAACDLSAFSARIAAIRANMRIAAGWRGVVLPPDRHLPARLLELFREFTTSSATRRGTGSEVSCLEKKGRRRSCCAIRPFSIGRARVQVFRPSWVLGSWLLLSQHACR